MSAFLVCAGVIVIVIVVIGYYSANKSCNSDADCTPNICQNTICVPPGGGGSTPGGGGSTPGGGGSTPGGGGSTPGGGGSTPGGGGSTPGNAEVFLFNRGYNPGFTNLTNATATANIQFPAATLATPDNMTAAYTAGAEWCLFGWDSDGRLVTPTRNNNCIGGTTSPPGVIVANSSAGQFGVNMYGEKPPVNGPYPNCAGLSDTDEVTNCLLPFSPNKWSQFD